VGVWEVTRWDAAGRAAVADVVLSIDLGIAAAARTRGGAAWLPVVDLARWHDALCEAGVCAWGSAPSSIFAMYARGLFAVGEVAAVFARCASLDDVWTALCILVEDGADVLGILAAGTHRQVLGRDSLHAWDGCEPSYVVAEEQGDDHYTDRIVLRRHRGGKSPGGHQSQERRWKLVWEEVSPEYEVEGWVDFPGSADPDHPTHGAIRDSVEEGVYAFYDADDGSFTMQVSEGSRCDAEMEVTRILTQCGDGVTVDIESVCPTGADGDVDQRRELMVPQRGPFPQRALFAAEHLA
jgi:hypothetical protein